MGCFLPRMRLQPEFLSRKHCIVNHGMQPATVHILPQRRMQCMAMAKGFGSLSVDESTAGKSKQRLQKKTHRRDHISHELQQLQAEELLISARAPPAPVKRSNGSKPSPASPSQQQMSPEEVASQARELQEEVLKLQEEIRSSSFFRGFLNTFRGAEQPAVEGESRGDASTSNQAHKQTSWKWDSVTHMVLYGLGSPRSSVAARYQLAFALLITELLPGLVEPLDTYDPAFNDVDRALLSNLGVTVHAEDEQCARVAQGPSLFYMPHCITAGFDNLLRANASCLDRLAILGNSFLGYRISWKIARSEREEIQEILQLMEGGRVREAAVDEADMEGISDRAFYRQSLHLLQRLD